MKKMEPSQLGRKHRRATDGG